jgi:hypothetical protein
MMMYSASRAKNETWSEVQRIVFQIMAQLQYSPKFFRNYSLRKRVTMRQPRLRPPRASWVSLAGRVQLYYLLVVLGGERRGAPGEQS